MFYGMTEDQVIFYTLIGCAVVACLGCLFLMRYRIERDYRAKKEEAHRLYSDDPRALAKELRSIDAWYDRKMFYLLAQGRGMGRARRW